ncbi:MAG: TRAP transporter permease [Pyramidobacter sp.]|jgi:TRAP transporter 4TM/12TM fusion protein
MDEAKKNAEQAPLESQPQQLNADTVTGNQQAVQENLEKYDTESRYRRPEGFWKIAIKLICIAFSLFQFYTAGFGVLPAQIQRPVHVFFTFVLIFLLYPSFASFSRKEMHWLDVLLAALAGSTMVYLVVNYEAILLRGGLPTTADLIFGAMAILFTFEAARRIVGLPIVLVALAFVLYAHYGNILPGFLAHRGFTWTRIINHMYLTTEGIMGSPIGVSSTFVFMFILFGAFLNKTGLGKFFIDLALAAAGHQAGGPAKVAVISSAFFGTISGSSVANTVTTGTFTIPLMKSIGYEPHFAGAVEAASSTGGQLMPPIMGAAAFIMSDFIGVPYITIAIAAILPALLYYMAVFVMIHMEAKRLGLKGLPKERLPQTKKIFMAGGHLLIPLFVIVYMLIRGYTPLKAAFYSILWTVAVAMCRKNTRMKLTDIIDAFDEGARSSLGVAAACACAGLVIGSVTLTGIGLKLANGIVALAGGHLFWTLVLTMVTSIILGMGLPTTAKYIVLASMAAPAIQKFGVPTLAAHMFIFYYGIIADLTPPVALAAYAGAGIAGANPMRTGFTALRLAVAGFLIPYFFVYSPELLMINASFANTTIPVVTAIAGTVLLSLAAAGYWRRSLNMLERIILFGGALLLIQPGLITDVSGAAIGVVAYFWLKKTSPHNS